MDLFVFLQTEAMHSYRVEIHASISMSSNTIAFINTITMTAIISVIIVIIIIAFVSFSSCNYSISSTLAAEQSSRRGSCKYG